MEEQFGRLVELVSQNQLALERILGEVRQAGRSSDLQIAMIKVENNIGRLEVNTTRLERTVTELAGAVEKLKDSVEEGFRATAEQFRATGEQIKQLADEGKATNARLDALIQAVDRYVSGSRNGRDKGTRE